MSGCGMRIDDANGLCIAGQALTVATRLRTRCLEAEAVLKYKCRSSLLSCPAAALEGMRLYNTRAGMVAAVWAAMLGGSLLGNVHARTESTTIVPDAVCGLYSPCAWILVLLVTVLHCSVDGLEGLMVVWSWSPACTDDAVTILGLSDPAERTWM